MYFICVCVLRLGCVPVLVVPASPAGVNCFRWSVGPQLSLPLPGWVCVGLMCHVVGVYSQHWCRLQHLPLSVPLPLSLSNITTRQQNLRGTLLQLGPGRPACVWVLVCKGEAAHTAGSLYVQVCPQGGG
jgi:hypothetical protein